MGCALSLVHKDCELQKLYKLQRILGEGVEGEVWLATAHDTGAHAAIKMIPRGDDMRVRPEAAQREIHLQAQLSHANIVELKQVILTPRHLAIVMSYEPGGDLHAFCTRFTIDEAVARYFFIQIISALDFCHQRCIAHRDLKLANFVLTAQMGGGSPPRVKLTDFGCSSHWQDRAPSRRMARFRTFTGTPAYMAPQVLESAFYPTNTYSAVEADVWACGILLCHMLFGRHTPFWIEPTAFRSESAAALERLRAMRGGRGCWAQGDPNIKQRAAGLSPELRDLLDSIFVAEEEERITIQGIREHPWFTGPLPEHLQASIDSMMEEQRLREKAAQGAGGPPPRSGLSEAGSAAGITAAKRAAIEDLTKLAAHGRRMPRADSRIAVVNMSDD